MAGPEAITDAGKDRVIADTWDRLADEARRLAPERPPLTVSADLRGVGLGEDRGGIVEFQAYAVRAGASPPVDFIEIRGRFLDRTMLLARRRASPG